MLHKLVRHFRKESLKSISYGKIRLANPFSEDGFVYRRNRGQRNIVKTIENNHRNKVSNYELILPPDELHPERTLCIGLRGGYQLNNLRSATNCTQALWVPSDSKKYVVNNNRKHLCFLPLKVYQLPILNRLIDWIAWSSD